MGIKACQTGSQAEHCNPQELGLPTLGVEIPGDLELDLENGVWGGEEPQQEYNIIDKNIIFKAAAFSR